MYIMCVYRKEKKNNIKILFGCHLVLSFVFLSYNTKCNGAHAHLQNNKNLECRWGSPPKTVMYYTETFALYWQTKAISWWCKEDLINKGLSSFIEIK